MITIFTVKSINIERTQERAMCLFCLFRAILMTADHNCTSHAVL